MPPRNLPRLVRAVTLTALASTAVSTVGACTALGGASAEPVVVTVTPTVTVMAGAAAPTPTPSPASSTAPALKSDDVGKAYDLGKIVDVKDVQGTKVISLDRYRNRTIPSARLFAEGMRLEPHARELFVSGASQTYSLPVLPDATFTRLTCVSPEAPAGTAASTLEELAGLTDREGIVLLQLDDKGWVKQVTSDPVCR